MMWAVDWQRILDFLDAVQTRAGAAAAWLENAPTWFWISMGLLVVAFVILRMARALGRWVALTLAATNTYLAVGAPHIASALNGNPGPGFGIWGLTAAPLIGLILWTGKRQARRVRLNRARRARAEELAHRPNHDPYYDDEGNA